MYEVPWREKIRREDERNNRHLRRLDRRYRVTVLTGFFVAYSQYRNGAFNHSSVKHNPDPNAEVV